MHPNQGPWLPPLFHCEQGVEKLLVVFLGRPMGLEEGFHEINQGFWPFLRHVVLLIEEVSRGEGLILKHGPAGLDGPIFITPFRLLCLLHWHLKGACSRQRVQSGCWSRGERGPLVLELAGRLMAAGCLGPGG